MAQPGIPAEIHRIGILTGGGDCPGLNAVIRAVVKTAINEYGWEVLGIEDGFEGLIQPGKVRKLGFDDVRGILPRGGTILGTTNRSNPFQYQVRTENGFKTVDLSEDVVRHAQVMGIDILIVVGGDGTLTLAHQLMQKGMRIVGVPKTIDNDLGLTSVTFGFDTALNTAMEALDKLHTTAESHHRIIILEVMGHNAGWIALEAGIAGGADIILIPEIPYEVDAIVGKIEARSRRDAKFSLVVVAEGARMSGGEQVYRRLGGPAEVRLGGIGETLAEQLRECCNLEVRVTVLGHLQRGGSPTAFDRLLATRFGSAAVHLAAQGKYGSMVALRNDEIQAVPIADAIARQKLVPLGSDLVLAARALGISLGASLAGIQVASITQGRGNEEYR